MKHKQHSSSMQMLERNIRYQQSRQLSIPVENRDHDSPMLGGWISLIQSRISYRSEMASGRSFCRFITTGLRPTNSGLPIASLDVKACMLPIHVAHGSFITGAVREAALRCNVTGNHDVLGLGHADSILRTPDWSSRDVGYSSG